MNRSGLIVIQVVGGLSILAYPFVLLANIMSLAAPGQTRAGAIGLALLSLYPIVWIVLYVISWRAMARGAVGLAFGLSSIPLVPCLLVAGLYVYGWMSFARGSFLQPQGDVRHKIEPANPLLWAVWSVGGENRYPPGPSLPADGAMRAVQAHPELVNIPVPPYGSPLKVAVENLSLNFDGTPIGYPPRQYELMRVVMALVSKGAHFSPGEETNLRNSWRLRRAMYNEPITTERENPLVWRILTRKRDGVTIFTLQPEDKPLLNTSTKLHGTPLYAALLQDAPDAISAVVNAGGRLSASEERDPAASAALQHVLAKDASVRWSYGRAR
jgi:hypothetical protein